MKARFTEKQPEVFWQPVDGKVFITICLNEKEVEEIMGDTAQTMYEYTCKQMWVKEVELDEETGRASPEEYLEYIPQKEKSETELLQEKIDAQQEQIQMLTECLLEVSEVVYQ